MTWMYGTYRDALLRSPGRAACVIGSDDADTAKAALIFRVSACCERSLYGKAHRPMMPFAATDLLGCVAAAAVLATFSLREMRALRSMAIVNNLLFAAYAYFAGPGPVLLLHMLLLSLNAVRFYQTVQRDRGRRVLAPLSARWPRRSVQPRALNGA